VSSTAGAARGGDASAALAFWALQAAKDYRSWCKSTRARRGNSPRATVPGVAAEEGTRRRLAAAGRRRSRGKVLQVWPGPLAGVDRLQVVLWRWQGGQGGVRIAGGEQLRRRMNLPAVELRGNLNGGTARGHR
jgi:hypothetical protein